jgi:hypothetical protein
MNETIIAEYQSVVPFYSTQHPEGYYPKALFEENGEQIEYAIVNEAHEIIVLVETIKEALVLAKHMSDPAGKNYIVRVKEIFKN